mmetsp:Transcript_27065/g.76091  ORF Transcript_27065/g.76091 Transcript_27065/m.76091 type:complete len:212 (+) Transcript_27065:367-1002(+)
MPNRCNTACGVASRTTSLSDPLGASLGATSRAIATSPRPDGSVPRSQVFVCADSRSIVSSAGSSTSTDADNSNWSVRPHSVPTLNSLSSHLASSSTSRVSGSTLAGETSTSLPRKQRIWSGGMGYPAAAPMVGGSLGASPQPAPSNSASASPDEKFSPVPSGSTSLTTGGDASAKAYSSRSCIASSSPPTSRWSRVLSAATVGDTSPELEA